MVEQTEAQKRASRKQHLKKYGLTPEQYDRLYAAQGGCCALCDTHKRDCRDLDIDHDHVTGRIRGLLCRRCNLSLGLIEKDGDIAKTLAMIHLYLVDPSAKHV
ncbi:hypothetical protein LCGC14_2256180 [marine sediment metagenome]|uniref:Recombination endonuclease VII n=1 Tax=marine sediment metagenome TaxID=412755 RepID=A0A0F9FW55_9ZZZZ